MKWIVSRPARFVVVLIGMIQMAGCAASVPSRIQEAVAPPPAVCPQTFDFAQRRTPNQYDLVFEGGGAKGTVFVGALQELEARGISGKRFVGTSAGAITATLLAAGYSAEEMLAAVNEKTADNKPRFSTFMDIPEKFEPNDIEKSYTYEFFSKVDMPFIPERKEKKIDDKIFAKLMEYDRYCILFSFIERGGAYEGMKFVDWFTEKLNADCRNLGSATLKEFYERTGNELTVVATDTTGHQKLVLNRLTAPDCPVVWAVRMSMSIPFVWQEVRWQEGWGKYRGDNISGHVVVDGGVLSNFPLNLVAEQNKEIMDLMGINAAPSGAVLGFLIDEARPVAGAMGTESVKRNTPFDNAMELKTVKRLVNLVDTMTEANDNATIRGNKNLVCHLPANGYGTTEFDMSEERVKLLIAAGREATSKYLDSMRK